MQPAPLFCKPLPGMEPAELLFLFTDPDLGGKIAFRSLDLNSDMKTIHEWVNQPYARLYWQMNMEKQELARTYTRLLQNLQAHSYIGLYNNEPVCQLDLYNGEEELKDYIPSSPGHCNLHILMHPPRLSRKGLTVAMLKAFTRFYFSFGASAALYAEPDQKNKAANTLAKKTGFHFLRSITLSYKTANLYSITRSQFFAVNGELSTINF